MGFALQPHTTRALYGQYINSHVFMAKQNDSGSRRRRRKKLKGSPEVSAMKSLTAPTRTASGFESESSSMPTSSTTPSLASSSTDNPFSSLFTESSRDSNYQSKLRPLSGTVKEANEKYLEKNFIERNLEEFLAPTPIGDEPKLVKLAKTVTWGAVILLVLVEIFVSLKVGGAPFDFGKASLPSLPPLPMPGRQ